MSVIAPVFILYRDTMEQNHPSGGQRMIERSHQPSGATAPVFAALVREVARRFPGHLRLDADAL